MNVPAAETDVLPAWPYFLPASGPGVAEWALDALFGDEKPNARIEIGPFVAGAQPRAMMAGPLVHGLAWLAVVDDVGPSVDKEVLDALGPSATMIVETSPRRYQYVFRFREPVSPWRVEPALIRNARLPSGVDNGFIVRLVEGRGVKVSLEEVTRVARIVSENEDAAHGFRDPKAASRLSPSPSKAGARRQ